MSVAEKKDLLQQCWEFVCECETCIFQANNPKLVRKSEKLLENYLSTDDYKKFLIRMVR
jgi:hypothetical protein